LPPALHIIFSRDPDVAIAAEYHRWYETRISRVPGEPGAAPARYELVPALDEPAEADRYTSAAVYEIDAPDPGAISALTAKVASASLEGAERFVQIRVSSWLAVPLGERRERGETGGDAVPQSLQLVFSDAGDAGHRVCDESLDGWYEQHLDEILSIPGFTSAQRYRLTTVTAPPGGAIPGRRLCVYTTTKPPAELRAEMERMDLLSADSYSRLKHVDSTGPALPQWWDTVRFASWNLIPLTPDR